MLFRSGQQRPCSRAENGTDASEKAEWRCDDSISGADVGGRQGEPDGVGSAGAANGMGHSAGLRGSLLEAGNLGAEDESLRAADSFNGIKQFLPEAGKLPGKIKHLNRLWVTNLHISHGISLRYRLQTLVTPWGSSNSSGSVSIVTQRRSVTGSRLIIAVNARIVDSLGFRLNKSVS